MATDHFGQDVAARYDERTASQLGEACGLLLDRYDGDLRQMREAAERDPAREKQLLQEIKRRLPGRE